MDNYPLKSHSWTVIGPRLGVKVVDKTLLNDYQTGIPQDIWPHLFPNLTLNASDKISWNALSILNSSNTINIEMTKTGRARINHLPIDGNLKIGDNLCFYFGEGAIKLFAWQQEC
ncbi:hypothetical protein VHA01S_010_00560 [Vibrio halioticoli NBRC 102217]|uniref:Uncharacterized protein n=1 Tax=Vibrio halioticoli NBRC 102217 TaxID=1219072 RepID=V5HHE7_9VIBR|nr:hypothetical protein [Vibrio halioticoli]GAD88830.1 hypothetical protein VHA01S_010_00560 [Vibrio halioticoli NBRC 102217]